MENTILQELLRFFGASIVGGLTWDALKIAGKSTVRSFKGNFNKYFQSDAELEGFWEKIATAKSCNSKYPIDDLCTSYFECTGNLASQDFQRLFQQWVKEHIGDFEKIAVHGDCNVVIGWVEPGATVNVVMNQKDSNKSVSVPTVSKQPATVITYSRPAQPSCYFAGRDGLISSIEGKLLGNAKLVLLSGIGGIGKTEICRALFHKYMSEALPPIENVGWLTFNDNIPSTFFNQFTTITAADDVDQYCAAVKVFLNQQGSKALLFIDNANDISENDAADLSLLSCKIILTSRKKLDRIEPVEVGKLPIDNCRTLYRKHSRDQFSSDEIIEAILEMAGLHTLSVELLAKTQQESGKSAQNLLETLKDKGFSLAGIDEEVSYLHNPEQSVRQKVEAIFIEHMAKIFDIAEIEEGSEELRILQLLSLLAAEPVSGEWIKRWFDLPNLNALNVLIRKGWLSRYQHDGVSNIYMHPVISSVIRHRAMPSADTAGKLVIKLADELHLNAITIFTAKLPFLPHAVSVAKYINYVDGNNARLLHNIALVYSRQEDYPQALEWYEKALGIREKLLGKEHPDTASTYNNIAGVYDSQGDYLQALEWYEKALEISEKVLGKEHPNTATTYSNIALVYSGQGDYAKALAWYEKALAIYEKVLGKEHPNTAGTYNNIAGVYSHQGDYPQALEWNEKSLGISEKVLGKEHPNTASTYNNIAFVYFRQGDYPKALEWCKKALGIREKVLGKKHPNTAASYNNIAFVYSSQGDYAKALAWYEKALAITEKVLGKEHPDTATTYSNIACVYFRQEDYPQALEWHQKALATYEKVLGKEHPSTASAYNNIALVHYHQGDYPQALEGYQKALCISEKVLSQEHPSTATIYNNIAEVYSSQGDYAKALAWYEKALAITEKVLGKEHPDTATTYSNIACVYYCQEDYPQALEWYQKSYNVMFCVLGSKHPYTRTLRDNMKIAYAHIGNSLPFEEWLRTWL